MNTSVLLPAHRSAITASSIVYSARECEIYHVNCHNTRIRESGKFPVGPRNPYSGGAYLTTYEGSS